MSGSTTSIRRATLSLQATGDLAADEAFSEYERLADQLGVPFAPNVTVGWDSSPRTSLDVPFTSGDYPWLPVFDASPAQFRRGIERALSFLERTSPTHPMLLINAWNEWTGRIRTPARRHARGCVPGSAPRRGGSARGLCQLVVSAAGAVDLRVRELPRRCDRARRLRK